MSQFFRQSPSPGPKANGAKHAAAAAAEAAKHEAMDQVEANANQLWIEFMIDMVWNVCLDMQQFTADDAFDYYDAQPNDKPRTHEPRAMGPVMNTAARLGYCVKANVPAKPSRRRSLHASPRTVWNSLIFEGKRQ